MKESAARILIVDDDIRTSALLERYLVDQGFTVHTVESGRRVEHVLNERHIELMVLDLMLP